MNPESHKTEPALAALVWWKRYPSTRRSVAAARHAVSRVLAERGVGEADRGTAELVVSELLTNAVRHGRVPGRLVELRMTYDLAKTVTLEVSDAGDLRPPTTPPEDPGETAESGRGLALVAAFADAWGVRDREVGKTIWARLIVERAASVSGGQHHGAMTNPSLTAGSTWRLRSGDQEVALLTVSGTDMPWVHADVETFAGFEEFRPLFTEQERAVDEEDWQRAEACCEQIRAALTMMLPDGNPVAEFMLHIHNDGTATWRWQDEPFDAVAP